MKRVSPVGWPAALIAAGIIALSLVAASLLTGQTANAQSWKYSFKQSQTQLTLLIESSGNINTKNWQYAGPLNNTDKCGTSSKFDEIDADLVRPLTAEKTGNKTARASLKIQKSDNNKYYCLKVGGLYLPRLIDYNPPIITLEKTNLLSAKDVYKGWYGPSGTVNPKSWQAAVFYVSKQSAGYGCDAQNGELVFKPVVDKIDRVANYSHGNTNYLAYYEPETYAEYISEFFEDLQSAIYPAEETDTTLIPVIDNLINEDFTDNIHLCHRVSDPQGNTTYKLMRLDLTGPAIRLELDGRTLRASSPSLDVDNGSWQYLATTNRWNRYACLYVDRLSEPTGTSAVIDNIKNDHWYCVSVLDKSGKHNGRVFKINAKDIELRPPPLVTTTNTRPSNNQNQQEEAEETPAEQPAVETGQRADTRQVVPPAAEPQPQPRPQPEPQQTTTDTVAMDANEQLAPQTAVIKASEPDKPILVDSGIREAADIDVSDTDLSWLVTVGLVAATVLVVGIVSVLFSGRRGSKKF
ncbi:hypothetical protein F4X86_01010 [Candidatus Saccharibacteria bacterium]|nr:hypothetical protein [Candidatus Saccharibacteria bacterium]